MKTMKSVKTQGGLREDLTPGNSWLPSNLVAMLDDAKFRILLKDADVTTEECDEMHDLVKMALREDSTIDRLSEDGVAILQKASFGRFHEAFGRYLPKTVYSRVAKARKEARENLEPWDLQRAIEDEGQLILSVINEVRMEQIRNRENLASRRRDTESIRVRRAQRDQPREDTKKFKVGGKMRWHNATVYELPPLQPQTSRAKKLHRGVERKCVFAAALIKKAVAHGWTVTSESGTQHQPAWYAMKLPDGTLYHLGHKQGNFRPVKCETPDKAAQLFASRLGLSLKGGMHSLMQKIWQRRDIEPAYMTVWQNEAWLTIVGWRRDPKFARSSVLLEGGKLSAGKKRTTEVEAFFAEHPELDEKTDNRLTVSQLDWLSYTSAADVAVEPEAQEDDDDSFDMMDITDEGLDEDEASLEDHRREIDTSRFDEDEMELVNYLCFRMGNADAVIKTRGIALGLQQSLECDNLMQDFESGSLGILDSQEADDLLLGTWDTRESTDANGVVTCEEIRVGGLHGTLQRIEDVRRWMEKPMSESQYLRNREYLDSLVKQHAMFERMLATRENMLADKDACRRPKDMYSMCPGSTLEMPENYGAGVKNCPAFVPHRSHDYAKEPVKVIPGASVVPRNNVTESGQVYHKRWYFAHKSVTYLWTQTDGETLANRERRRKFRATIEAVKTESIERHVAATKAQETFLATLEDLLASPPRLDAMLAGDRSASR
jgi:hypothetical protein